MVEPAAGRDSVAASLSEVGLLVMRLPQGRGKERSGRNLTVIESPERIDSYSAQEVIMAR